MQRVIRILAIVCLWCLWGCDKEGQLPRIDDVCSVIPDEGFRQHCYDSFDTDHDGRLSMEEAASVTNMTVIGESVKSLDGIEYFTGLTALFLRDTQVSSLDMSKNTKLEVLQCASNQLTRLYVSDNALLRTLECPGNQLKFLDVSKNQQLEGLYCGNNQLSSLNLSNNRKLKYLSCKNNLLTSLDLSNNPQLELLVCSFNRLSSLDVSMTKWFLTDQHSYSLSDVDQRTPAFTLIVSQDQKRIIDEMTVYHYSFSIVVKGTQ